MTDADVDAYFTLITGSRAGVGAVIDKAALRKVSRDLRIDLTSEQLDMMIACFDQGGKGGLSLADFRRLMRLLG